MPLPIEPIVSLVRGMVHIGEWAMQIFEVIHHFQTELTTYTRVGEAPVEKESREWRETLIKRWYWIAGMLMLIAGVVLWVW